ncbi:MAG: hypothetical protein GWN58_24880, partial [Anaerolineae bacterium]|nr:hypothetical protein [Anaerolineae bacterium]
ISKKSGAKALIESVEQASARYVRIKWDLNIRWGRQGDLLPPHLVGLISPDRPREWLSARAGELEDLLRKLFYDYDQVTLGEVLTWRERWFLLT